MSAATWAATANERANIAAAYLRRGATDSRAFYDCFEMGDGDEVQAILWQRAASSPTLDAAMRRVFAPHAFPENRQ